MKVTTLKSPMPQNPRTCVIAEPLFVIPYNMYTTYASVYMLQTGLTSVQLGWLTTMNLVVQMLSALVSGYATDRMGRKKALWVADLVSWSAATLLWAVSHSWWGFALAFFFNGFQRISTTAWYCLLTEDTPADIRSRVFTALQVVATVAGFFAPIAGWLIHRTGVVLGTRLLYLYAFASMTTMIAIRHRGLRETNIGRTRMAETRRLHLRHEWRRIRAAIKTLSRNRTLMWLFGVYVMWNVQISIRTTFVTAYQMDALHIPPSFMGLLPALSSLVMAVCLATFARRFHDDHGYHWMQAGLGLLTAATILLAISAPRSVAPTIIATALTAAGTVLANPFVESLVANAMDDAERSTMLAVLNVLILLSSSPSGAIAGYLYAWNPRSSPVFAALALVASLVCAEAARRARHTPTALSTQDLAP